MNARKKELLNTLLRLNKLKRQMSLRGLPEPWPITITTTLLGAVL